VTEIVQERRWIGIQEEPIDTAKVLAAVADPACGAASLFLGIVRDHHEGRSVIHLEYEAYDAMVLEVFGAIAEELSERWDVRRLALVHRKGKLEIGELAVAVAVSTPHRRDSFEACRYGIDEIKSRAPVWKKELYREGGERWIDNCEGCAEAGRLSRESAEARDA